MDEQLKFLEGKWRVPGNIFHIDFRVDLRILRNSFFSSLVDGKRKIIMKKKIKSSFKSLQYFHQTIQMSRGFSLGKDEKSYEPCTAIWRVVLQKSFNPKIYKF